MRCASATASLAISLMLGTSGFAEDTSEVLQGASHQARRDIEHGPQSVEGDCDCRSIYVQAMLEGLGYTTRFATVRQPGTPQLSHVFCFLT